ncbi:hypothetical protein SVAN01_01566 [Stagonosporopsis vannaccii]|nr:hypothetical protein SVAN01_01566 [Stagonosporopsis vannaccii]
MFSKSKSPATETSKSSVPARQNDTPSPPNTDVAADMSSLLHGNPKDIISVPMVHSNENTRLRDVLIPFKRVRGKGITQSVVVRKMTREHYLKHYARDASGTYIGTEIAAVDAGLVFVPSQSSSQELSEQVRKVAFGREHDQEAFQVHGSSGDGG